MFGQQPKVRIVIVDDSADVRRDLRLLIEIAGDFDVIGEAADGQSAADQAVLRRPDVVLMDLAMPGLDGFEAAACIRSALAECRMVALTVHSDDESRSRARAAGFDAFVVKGASLSELLGAIRPLAKETPLEEGPRTGGRS